MTQEQLINHFISGDEEGVCDGGRNLRILQDKLIHYQTPIAERTNGKIYINVTRYSMVTGRIQKMLVERVPKDKQIIVKSVEEGTKRSLVEYEEKHKD